MFFINSDFYVDDRPPDNGPTISHSVASIQLQLLQTTDAIRGDMLVE